MSSPTPWSFGDILSGAVQTYEQARAQRRDRDRQAFQDAWDVYKSLPAEQQKQMWPHLQALAKSAGVPLPAGAVSITDPTVQSTAASMLRLLTSMAAQYPALAQNPTFQQEYRRYWQMAFPGQTPPGGTTARSTTSQSVPGAIPPAPGGTLPMPTGPFVDPGAVLPTPRGPFVDPGMTSSVGRAAPAPSQAAAPDAGDANIIPTIPPPKFVTFGSVLAQTPNGKQLAQRLQALGPDGAAYLDLQLAVDPQTGRPDPQLVGQYVRESSQIVRAGVATGAGTFALSARGIVSTGLDAQGNLTPQARARLATLTEQAIASGAITSPEEAEGIVSPILQDALGKQTYPVTITLANGQRITTRVSGADMASIALRVNTELAQVPKDVASLETHLRTLTETLAGADSKVQSASAAAAQAADAMHRDPQFARIHAAIRAHPDQAAFLQTQLDQLFPDVKAARAALQRALVDQTAVKAEIAATQQQLQDAEGASGADAPQVTIGDSAAPSPAAPATPPAAPAAPSPPATGAPSTPAGTVSSAPDPMAAEPSGLTKSSDGSVITVGDVIDTLNHAPTHAAAVAQLRTRWARLRPDVRAALTPYLSAADRRELAGTPPAAAGARGRQPSSAPSTPGARLPAIPLPNQARDRAAADSAQQRADAAVDQALAEASPLAQTGRAVGRAISGAVGAVGGVIRAAGQRVAAAAPQLESTALPGRIQAPSRLTRAEYEVLRAHWAGLSERKRRQLIGRYAIPAAVVRQLDQTAAAQRRMVP